MLSVYSHAYGAANNTWTGDFDIVEDGGRALAEAFADWWGPGLIGDRL